MTFYLRVEAVNLSHFINDTKDLSTTRGGSLLLLEAMEEVEGIIKNQKISQIEKEIADLENQLNELNNIQNPTQSDKNKKSKLREKLRKLKETLRKIVNHDSPSSITKGASWGLFNLDMPDEDADHIKDKVIDYFKNDILYKHATFVVDLHPNNGDQHYQKDRNRLQSLNRRQQMQAPSLAICKEGTKCCAIDKIRPSSTERWLKDKEEGEKDKGKDYVSDSVHLRREYGRDQKQKFYEKVTGTEAKFTKDLGALSKSANQGILDNKIAYIYIDGNSFGEIQRGCDTPKAQQDFDNNTRRGRECLLKNILEQIATKPDWLTQDKEVRLETLLWGGDEIIWVVPAWQGWWMINEFYKQAKQHIKHNNTSLFHATGLVFCHHNAPIHRIDSLARALADLAKADRESNLIAYQILESFDHAGTQLSAFREDVIKGLGKLEHLLVTAEKISEVHSCISELKKDDDFAKRKVYQILEAYREGKTATAEQYIAKLSDDSPEPLEKLKTIFGGENAHWLHLMNLWDYISGDHND